MTRTPLGTALAVALALAACGGAATPATRTPGAATTPPAGGTPAGGTPAGGTPAGGTPAGQTTQPTSQPQGGGTIAVTLTGGPDAGTYTGGADPHCSFGFVSPSVWGVAYVDPAGAPGSLGAANVITQAAAQGDTSLPFSADVTIGAQFVGNTYGLVRDAGDASQSINITDNGATAVIHVVGTTTVGTTAGVGVDMTVNCPSIIRP
jgi:hypothetical protein